MTAPAKAAPAKAPAKAAPKAAAKARAASPTRFAAQLAARGNQAALRAQVPRIAGEGVAGATAPLPHLGRIQAAFGRHDVSGVRAAIGGRGGAAATQLGAAAYATGDRIAFRTAPDARLAAHEAAHVVQQRAGVQLDGGVGRAGDPYERLADQVADAVVAGRSAEALLDGAFGGARTGVQLQCECGSSCDRCSRGGAPAVQLQIFEGAPPSPEASPEAAAFRSLLFASTVLAHTPAIPASDRALLDRIVVALPIYDAMVAHSRAVADIARSRQELVDLEHRPARSSDPMDAGPPLPGGVGATAGELDALRAHIAEGDVANAAAAEDIRRSQSAGHFATPDDVVHLIEVDFPAIWVRRAKQIAVARLDVSRDQVLAEQRRYPGGGGGDIPALRAADAELGALADARDSASRSDADVDREIAQLRERRTHMEEERRAAAAHELSGGVGPTGDEMRALDAQILAAESRSGTSYATRVHASESFEAARVRLGGEHPLLTLGPYRAGMFRSQTDSQMAATTHLWTQEILDNIARTRANIDDDTIKVWDLNDIPEQTYNSLDVPTGSTLRGAVDRLVAGERSNAYWLGIGQTVLEVVLVIGVTIANPVAGAVLAVAISSGHLAADIVATGREEAAGHTHVLAELADISAGDPDYLAVLVDVASLGLDIFQLGAALSALRPAAAALRVGTSTVEGFERAARAALPAEAAEVLTERTVRRLAFRSAGERLSAAREWVTRTLRLPGTALLDLSENAISRLRSLPREVLEWLRGLPEAVCRAALGCASPCRVDLEEILRLFRESVEAGGERTAFSGTGSLASRRSAIVAALPEGIETSRIATQLVRHPGLLAAIESSGLTVEDFAHIAEFLTPADLANARTAYQTFTRFVSMAASVRIGADPAQLIAVLSAMRAAEARGASSALRGSIFEAWTRTNIRFADAFERLTVYIGGGRITADRWVSSLGEIWDMKAYLGIAASDLVDMNQARLYNRLVGRMVGEGASRARVSSINYLFLTRGIAEANAAGLARRGLHFQIWYLGPGNLPVLLP